MNSMHRRSKHCHEQRANSGSVRNVVLGADFFDRRADHVARALIGMTLVRQIGSTRREYKIKETEAYLGAHDRACHSARGRTRRTEVMFGTAGQFYIYRIYGLHLMLNVVTGPQDEASAVLIRSAGDCSGPGRLARHVNVTSALNGQTAEPNTKMWFERPSKIEQQPIRSTARIGVGYAGTYWSRGKFRFILLPPLPARNVVQSLRD